jgi:DNA invertase Pin-like site-specific DNA recombinase
MNRKKPEEDRSRIRCAIYTRKSTEERLDLEFNSLDAQRDAAESFIASQKSEGWVCLPKRYDDGGFSGPQKKSCCQRSKAAAPAERLSRSPA